ncbi:MAG: amidohydrolase family protein [Clostridia bacterium]|nr:amidohydrolase family protein [Clostridia bacterium]
MKKIDIHVHTSMWENAQINQGVVLASPEQLKESYAELDVDKAFLLPLISPEWRFCAQTNEEIEFLANKYSDTFYWFCNVDPRMGKNSASTDLSAIIMHYKSRGAKGVGEVTANLRFDDPLMDNLFYHCEMCDMPVTIHIAPKKYDYYGIIDELGLPGLEKMLKKHPKLKVFGHSQCFWSHISADVTEESMSDYPVGKVTEGALVRLMRECPNLYCDVSAMSGYNALSRDNDFAYKFIEEFGDRMFYGTDICRAYQKTYLAGWLDKAYEDGCISYDNYRSICRGNAIRVLNLDLPE